MYRAGPSIAVAQGDRACRATEPRCWGRLTATSPSSTGIPTRRRWRPTSAASCSWTGCVTWSVRRSTPRPVSSAARSREAGIESADDITELDDINRIPVTLKQDLRDSEAEHPPLGDYRFAPLSECVRIGQSTGTTGTPTISVLTRHDIWLEYESAARNWWRNGWRPGQTVTHCHPAYLYGGGLMLSGTLEYFGFLNLWVPPPDTDELAEQAIKVWQRIHPDLQMVALSQHRFQEVATKMGVDLQADCGFPAFSHGRLRARPHAADDRRHRVLRLPRRPGPGVRRRATSTRTGRSCRPSTLPRAAMCPRVSGATSWSPRSIATTACCGTTWKKPRCWSPATARSARRAVRGFWGGRFSDLLDSQGVHFQVSDLERAVASVRELAKPTLEFVVVKPDGSPDPLQIRVEVSADEGRPDDDRRAALAGQVARGGAQRARARSRGRRARPRHVGPVRLQVEARRRGVTPPMCRCERSV